MPSFSNKKRLKFIITLGNGVFKRNGVSVQVNGKWVDGGQDQIVIEGLRASVQVEKAGGVQMSYLRAKIWGVSQHDMSACAAFKWQPMELAKNTIEVIAIDGDAETLVFFGTFVNCWGDYQSAPDVFMYVEASTAYREQIQPANPTSYQGAIDAAAALRNIADAMGLTFEKNNATAVLNDIYVANTLTEQAKEIAKAANFNLFIDDKTMAITPQNGARVGIIPQISAQSGLVGYPTFDGLGVNFVSLYNPAIIFGGQVDLVSDIRQAAGIWNVSSLSHRLECERPNGQWFSNVRGVLGEIGIVR